MRVKINTNTIAASVTHKIPSMVKRREIARGVSAAAMQYWKKLAQSELRSTSRDYIAGLQRFDDDGKSVIELTGRVPNMVEQGFAGGDMRQWMKNSKKAKKKKGGGWYLSVPFRHGTPGTGGRNVGASMPQPVHKAAKRLTPTLSAPQMGTKWGARLSPHGGPGAAIKKILNTKKKDWHTTSIYTGMVRKEKTYEKATQNSYTTFRTISDKKSHAQSWIHPGIKARRFAKRVQAHTMKKIIPAVVTNMLGGD